MKKIFCILILLLVVAYPNFCIEPPLVDTLDNEYIIIGSFIIHMSQVTQDNFKAASLTITDTQKIYYKSKFADGTWFRVDEGVEIKDIILKGNSGTMKSEYMDSYFKFTLMIEPGGKLIKFGEDGGVISINPQIVTLEDLIKEKDDQIAKMMAQVKGDINDSLNEAIVAEVAQLNYDKSLFENFDDKSTIKKDAIKDKLAEIEKAKEENNIKLEYELYNELEELDEATFNKESKLELLLTSLEDIESLNDLKTKFLANGFENLVEELELELASKTEVVADLSSKILAQNIKDLLAGGLSEEKKINIIAMNTLINKRMKEAAASASEEIAVDTLNVAIESIIDDLVSSLINSEAGINLKTGESLIAELLKEDSMISDKLKAILEGYGGNTAGDISGITGGDIGEKIQADSLTIDLIKNKLETLLTDLNKNLSKVDKLYEEILGENFESKTKMLSELDKTNKVLIAKLEELAELERLQNKEKELVSEIKSLSKDLNLDTVDSDKTDLTDESDNANSKADNKLKVEKEKLLENIKKQLIEVEKQIAIITGNLQLDDLIEKLMFAKESLMLEKTKLDINDDEVDSIKDLATEVTSAVKSVDKKDLLEDDRLNDLITGFNLKADIDKLGNYSDEIVSMLNRNYEADMLKLLKESYYLIKDYNSDKKKIYIENLELYTSRIKEIDLAVHRYKNLIFVDKELTYMRYDYWISVMSRNFEDQIKYLNIINEYENIDQKLKLEEQLNNMNLEEFKVKLEKLNFESKAAYVSRNLLN